MNVASASVYHNAALGTAPTLVAFTGGRPAGMVGIKAKIPTGAANFLIIGVPNSGIPGSSSAPSTMTTGNVWDEGSGGQTLYGGAEYGDISKDLWVCLVSGTGEVSIWPLVNQ